MTKTMVWRRLDSKEAFIEAFADRPLVGEGVQFTIHADGQISGMAGPDRLLGNWYWQDGMFCRTATLNDEDLGLDREIIEQCGDQMRYTRDSGKGAASIVTIKPL